MDSQKDITPYAEIPQVTTQGELEIIQKMYDNIMTQKWIEVLSTYRTYAFARLAKLTYKSEETALHLAIYCYLPSHGSRSKNHLKCIKDMVDSIPEDEVLDVLKLKNDTGDTPLHLAAQLGNVEICERILSKVEKLHEGHELISERNSKKETPLFLAAHRCKVDAFRLLHKEVKEREDRIHLCRKEKGETILHSALSGEYFELAYEIIEKYPELVNCVNEDGMSPLHILAWKPPLFMSSSYFGTFESIIYHCTDVRTLHKRPAEDDENDDFLFPENWRTLVDSLELIWNVIRVAFWIFIGIAFKRKAFKRKTVEGNGPTAQVIDPEKQDSQPQGNINNTRMQEDQRPQGAFPVIYYTDIWFLKFVIKTTMTILGSISLYGEISRITEKKEKHTWAVQIMHKLILVGPPYMYQNAGGKPWRDPIMGPIYESPMVPIYESPMSPIYESPMSPIYESPMVPPATHDESKSDIKNDNPDSNKFMVTPLLAAAKMGILEIVEKVLKTFPASIQDADPSQKNVLLVAVENRKISVFDFLRKQKLPELMCYQVDTEGNSAAHLAAMYDGRQHWRFPGDALQLQGELKWYKHVKNNMPPDSYVRFNKKGQTPWDVFQETHEELNKRSTEWIIKASESCSVVAVLIATVAFATSATVPGGVDKNTGYPVLEREPEFLAFAVSSLVALCFSVLSLIFFLPILTSPCQPKDFTNDLPRKLLFGLIFLFTSIVAILICFCAGHSFILKDNLKFAAHPIYGVVCLLVTYLAFRQLPLYDLLRT